MRIRNIKNSNEIINDCSFIINNPKEYKSNYNELFNNNNEIHLEIGMGKGTFLLQMALNNPNINYIGIEKYDSIVARAIQKIESYKLNNLMIIKNDAINIDEFFDHQISKLYLNFSDPWPKKRHSMRRLTSEFFLKKYDNIFLKDKIIEMKTDNDILFESSVLSLCNYGYIITEFSLNINKLDKINYKTEYEEKFNSKGINIKYLKSVKK